MKPHEYFSLPLEKGISHSMIQDFKKNPFAFWVQNVCKFGPRKPPTDEMALGTYLDCLIFAHDGADKQLKELLAIKGEKKFAKIRQKAEALFFHFNGHFGNYARSILMSQPWGEMQKTIFWTDDNGVPRKGLVDFISHDAKTIADLKTTGDLDNFVQSVRKFGYYEQAAGYIDGCREYGMLPERFLWIVLETNFPWRIKVFKADPGKLAQALDENLTRAKQLWDRVIKNDWNFEQTEPEQLETNDQFQVGIDKGNEFLEGVE